MVVIVACVLSTVVAIAAIGGQDTAQLIIEKLMVPLVAGAVTGIPAWISVRSTARTTHEKVDNVADTVNGKLTERLNNQTDQIVSEVVRRMNNGGGIE